MAGLGAQQARKARGGCGQGLAGDARDQVEVELSLPAAIGAGLSDDVKGGFDLGGIGPTAQSLQGLVGKALDAEAEAIDAMAAKYLQQGGRQGFGIGLEGEFGV